MRYTVPDYYKKFVCLAGDCPATCCAGWQIVIDERSLKKYRREKGAFGNRLRNSVNWKEGTYEQYGGRCAFLNDQNLCDLHIEGGVEMMCKTCRRYPRHVEEFENEREITLSMSCPAAARLILEKQESVRMISFEDQKEEKESEDFDFFLYSALQDSRGVMIRMLQEREVPVHRRMAQVLAMAGDLQNRINSRRVFDMETVLERYQKPGAKERLFRKLDQEQALQADVLLRIPEQFEVLDETWRRDLNIWKQCAERQGTEKISETEIEQMAVYYLYTYFCGAVYDGDALAKVKMAFASVLIWEELCRAESAQKGKNLSFEERLQLAYRYSRELEHSDQNLNRMEELMNTLPETELHAFLGYLRKQE